MSNPIVLSDEEEGIDRIDLSTPLEPQSKKRCFFTNPNPNSDSNPNLNPPVLILDDDPTPRKSASTSTPSVVPETPLSDLAIVKCTMKNTSADSHARVSDSNPSSSRIGGLIYLESDNEPDSNCEVKERKEAGRGVLSSGEGNELRHSSEFAKSTCHIGDSNLNQACGHFSYQTVCPVDTYEYQVDDCIDKENFSMEQLVDGQKNRSERVEKENKTGVDGAIKKKKMTKEERIRMMEERKIKKEQEKLNKAIMKAEASKLKKLQKEKQKWEKGKSALKSIVAEIDAKVVEQGSIGGHLLTRFTEKGLAFRIKSNPLERSIVWTMSVPEQLSELSPQNVEILYITFVFDAEDFCKHALDGSFSSHINRVRSLYPSHTICYLTNRLTAYINKREQEHYKNPTNCSGWKRPPVEEALARFTTDFVRVHSRQCVDEAEVADHIVGLTCSLASCQFRKKLTRLSVNANGSIISKAATERNLLKQNMWLKALVAIPKVQPRFAIAIWKKYPTMKSLLSVYMDPNKSVHEKEFLLKDLTTEGLLGEDRKLGELCSKRVYRVLMARSSSIRTDDVENGADFFT